MDNVITIFILLLRIDHLIKTLSAPLVDTSVLIVFLPTRLQCSLDPSKPTFCSKTEIYISIHNCGFIFVLKVVCLLCGSNEYP